MPSLLSMLLNVYCLWSLNDIIVAYFEFPVTCLSPCDYGSLMFREGAAVQNMPIFFAVFILPLVSYYIICHLYMMFSVILLTKNSFASTLFMCWKFIKHVTFHL